MSDLCPVAASVNAMNLEDQPETIGGSLLWLLESKKFCDVVFTFPNLPDRIEAHEFCLKTRSRVFEQIFRMRKSGNVEGNEIEISESTPEVFQQFLEFIYVDKFEVDITQALDLLHLAQKYKVNPLIKKCEQLLLTELLEGDSVKIFETARRYGRRELMDRAGQRMVKSFLKLARSDALANAEEETLIYLLERDDLAVREVGLFQFILNWGRNQVGTPNDQELSKSKLKNLISKVRYTNMDPNEFTKVVVPTGLLSAEESLAVYAFLSGDETTRQDLKIEFNISPRRREMSAVVENFFYFTHGNYRTGNAWFPAFSKHSMSFKVDRAKSDGKLLPGHLLTKTVITKVNIWKPAVEGRYQKAHTLNFSVLIGDYAGPVQTGNFTIRFQKNLVNLLGKHHSNQVSVYPPIELMLGRTYSVIIENLSTVDSVGGDGFWRDPEVYCALNTSNFNEETHVDFEEVSMTLKEFHMQTDYYARNLHGFSEELLLIEGVGIGLQ